MKKNQIIVVVVSLVVLIIGVYFVAKKEFGSNPLKVPKIEDFTGKDKKNGKGNFQKMSPEEKRKMRQSRLAVGELKEDNWYYTKEDLLLIEDVKKRFSKHSIPEEKIEMLDELWGIEHPAVVDVVLMALQDESADVRKTAIELIEDFESEKVLPAVELALDDDNPEIRETAINTLYYVQTADSTNLLIKAVDDQSSDVRETVFDIIEDRPPKVQEYVFEFAIKSRNKDVKERVTDMIIDIPSHNTMGILIDALDSNDQEFKDEVKNIIDFFVSEEFDTAEEAKTWWRNNKNRFDEELFEKY